MVHQAAAWHNKAAHRLSAALVIVVQDVTEVVNTCHTAGISAKAVKLRPIAVIKG